MKDHYFAVIMAGGGGTRLWPVSRHDSPKQTLKLFAEKSLFQLAVERLDGYLPLDRVFVVTSADLVGQLQAQVPEMNPANFLIEPQPRGTAAVVALAAATLRKINPEAVLAVLTADHLISDKVKFQSCLRSAGELANQGYIVTLGIKPTHAATGYGYIERGAELGVFSGIPGYRVVNFIEKPDQNRAKELVSQEKNTWNSGMFISRADVMLSEYESYMPELFSTIQSLVPIIDGDHRTPAFLDPWMAIKPQTIDYGIMEKTSLAAVLPLPDLEWIDVGCWDSFFDVFKADANGNIVVQARFEGMDTSSSLILSTDADKLIVTMGMRNLIVIQTPDAILICPRGESQRVKELVNYLKEHRYTLYL